MKKAVAERIIAFKKLITDSTPTTDETNEELVELYFGDIELFETCVSVIHEKGVPWDTKATALLAMCQMSYNKALRDKRNAH